MREVLFICVGNSCRSQMAEAMFNHRAPSGYRAVSAGTEPASRVSSGAVQAMAELGIDIGGQHPKPIARDTVEGAFRIISMGCGVEGCPAPVHEDWAIVDPMGQPIERFREVRDTIKARVEKLIEELKNEK
ncbi:MAG: arsenate reductase ArsC [Dehalococcoidia bacterium]